MSFPADRTCKVSEEGVRPLKPGRCHAGCGAADGGLGPLGCSPSELLQFGVCLVQLSGEPLQPLPAILHSGMTFNCVMKIYVPCMTAVQSALDSTSLVCLQYDVTIVPAASALVFRDGVRTTAGACQLLCVGNMCRGGVPLKLERASANRPDPAPVAPERHQGPGTRASTKPAL